MIQVFGKPQLASSSSDMSFLKCCSIMTKETDCNARRNCSKQEEPNPNTSPKDRRGNRTNIQGPTQWGFGSGALSTPLAKLLCQNARSRRSSSTPLLGFIIVIGTITIAVGNFFGALSKIREFWKLTEGRATNVAELQNAVRATSIELKQEFDSVTVGRTPPIPEPDFRRVLELIAKIERLDHGNGHVIYYRAFVKRWRNQRPASHDGLFWYLERAKDPNLFLPGDNGDAKFCFDNWLGFCKQRQGFINHTLAIDFQKAANETKDPAVALDRLKAALDRARAAITVYGEFTDPGQGLPTKILAERLQTQISDTENALKGTARK
jgi:hypothetical protein